MRLGTLATALVVCLLLGAAASSPASAAVETKGAEWYTGVTETGVTTLTGEQTATFSVAAHPGIGSKITVLLGIASRSVHIVATGIEGLECKITVAEITGKSGTVAFAKCKLRLTGATVDSPSGCTVRNKSATGTIGVIETEPLQIHGDWVDTNIANQKAFLQFLPQSGTTFGTVYLEGGECEAISGAYKLGGSLFAETANNKGVMATTQTIVFGPAVQTTTGAELKVGSSRAELTGSATMKAEGKFFGIK